MPPTPIPNKGNTCYAASILQCLRRIFNPDLDIAWDKLPGTMEDAHEFYCTLVNGLPPKAKSNMMVKFTDGVQLPYVSVTPEMEGIHGELVESDKVICLYRIPTAIDANSCTILRVLGKTYTLCAAVCQVPNHYYAIVEYDDIWYRCNDDIVIEEPLPTHPLYMCFYIRTENT